MGGVRYSDKKRWVDLIPTGNAQNFKSVLLIFYKDIQREWIEQGNKREDFDKNGLLQVKLMTAYWQFALLFEISTLFFQLIFFSFCQCVTPNVY